MKKNLLVLLFVAVTSFVNAQTCTPDPNCLTGLCPDTVTNLPDGYIGQPYDTTITTVVPDDTTFFIDYPPFFSDSVTFTMDSVICTNCDDPNDIGLPTGLAVVCKNPSQTECVFLNNSKDCMWLTGSIPNDTNLLGTWELVVRTRAYLTCKGPANACSFLSGVGMNKVDTAIIVYGYRIDVLNPSSGINEIKGSELIVSQNNPNPFSKITTIKYTNNKSGKVNFKVYNMLGEVVYAETLSSKNGENLINFNAKEIPSGIYSYSLNNGEKTISKRMILMEN